MLRTWTIQKELFFLQYKILETQRQQGVSQLLDISVQTAFTFNIKLDKQ